MFYSTSLYYTLQVLLILQIESLWQLYVKEVYRHRFSNSICFLVSVSHFGNSHSISNLFFFIFLFFSFFLNLILFFKLYIIVLVLPNIKMNPPQVYMCSPFLNPPPSSLPIPSLWVVPVHQPQASSIVHRTWTGNSFHT